ncbi:class E sortase [Demequina aurantiaca]|uniref:class E sortase n=1 Tax=Demequina aurantiaca TaxID=676200 RepID=UPI0007843221|nr:class E sortase [Demequina aurantiaca]
MPTIEQTSPSHAAPRRQSRWAAAVGLLGELLIIAGVVLGLYVVWQLFYTDIAANNTQQEVVDGLDWVAPLESVTAGEPVNVIPDNLKFDPDSAPVMEEPAFTTTFATMYVPRWGTDYVKPISEGVTRRDVLDTLGIGHYPGTGMPGELGNFAISAHRTTYGKPFNRIAELKKGDPLVIETEDAWYVYRVTEWEIVKPTQVEVIAPVPDKVGAEPDDHYITLTTCHPMYSAAERWVTHGTLEYWAPHDAGVPAEILEDAS